MESLRPIKLIWTTDRALLVQDIKERLQVLLAPQPIESELLDYNFFKDTSPDMEVKLSVRGKHVYVISDAFSDSPGDENIPTPSLNDRYHYARSLRRISQVFGAKTVNAILPAFPYARDDKFDAMGTKQSMKRKPNAASMVMGDCLSAWLDHVITDDIHNLSTISIPTGIGFKTKFVSLAYGRMIEDVMYKSGLDRKKTVLSWTDEGALKKVVAVCEDLGLNNLIAFKARDHSKSNSVSKIRVYGSIKNKDILLYDDMLDTWGTMLKCLDEINKKHPNSVTLVVSHGLFNGDCLEKLWEAYEQGKFKKLYITNSVYQEKFEKLGQKPDWIEVIDISVILAHTISSIAQERDINYNNNFPILPIDDPTTWDFIIR